MSINLTFWRSVPPEFLWSFFPPEPPWNTQSQRERKSSFQIKSWYLIVLSVISFLLWTLTLKGSRRNFQEPRNLLQNNIWSGTWSDFRPTSLLGRRSIWSPIDLLGAFSCSKFWRVVQRVAISEREKNKFWAVPFMDLYKKFKTDESFDNFT